MMAIAKVAGIRQLALLAVGVALALSMTGCASVPMASHGTDGIANFPIYGD